MDVILIGGGNENQKVNKLGIMNESKGKMNKGDWVLLFLASYFFDFCGFLCLIVDFFLLGGATITLNIFAGLTFVMWAIIWSNKGLGAKFFVTLMISWFVETIPIVGSILPTWTFMIYRAKLNYERGSSLTGAISGKLGGKIAGSNLSVNQKMWANRALGAVSGYPQYENSLSRVPQTQTNEIPETNLQTETA